MKSYNAVGVLIRRPSVTPEELQIIGALCTVGSPAVAKELYFIAFDQEILKRPCPRDKYFFSLTLVALTVVSR